jgi:hypothetical protein
MTRPLSKSARRAMADALRHMHQSGTRFTDLRHGSGATQKQVVRSLDRIILPGRDCIGLPPAGVVSPRHADSSHAGYFHLAGGNGTDAPVAPAPFPGGDKGGEGCEQSWAVDHAAVVPCGSVTSHGAEQGSAVP